ncbi:Hypothetical bacteriophage protein [Moritella viscosa]|uniref:Hypothetical bacteriophage protein n=2 Tax=Moritella viscosa TaxID=80854 RepID=A0A1K9YWT0_9GAMM|nr:Hypothetical bacteriophage protein [Moritella viscosa]
MYFAIEVCPDGGTIRDGQTHEPRTVEIGECDTKQDAIDNACQQLDCQQLDCQQLDCRQLFRGVIGRPKGKGGYVVLNAQDYAEV